MVIVIETGFDDGEVRGVWGPFKDYVDGGEWARAHRTEYTRCAVECISDPSEWAPSKAGMCDER